MSAAPYPTSPTSAAVDPGRTLGIVGPVLSFVTSLPGLIISIIVHRRSKAAGFNNVPAKVGIVAGSLFTAFGLMMATIGVVAVGPQVRRARPGCPPVRRHHHHLRLTGPRPGMRRSSRVGTERPRSRLAA